MARLEEWWRPLLVGLALTAILRGILSWIKEQALARLELKLSIATSSQFLWHILRLPVEFYAQRYGGEISARVAMNDRVAEFLANQLASRAIDAVSVVFFGLLMFNYDTVLPLVGIGAVAVLSALTWWVNRKRVDGNRRLLAEEGKATGALMGGLATIETLKASAGESDLFARWAGYQAKFINSGQELATTTQLFLTTPPFVISVTNGSGTTAALTALMVNGSIVASWFHRPNAKTPLTDVWLGSR